MSGARQRLPARRILMCVCVGLWIGAAVATHIPPSGPLPAGPDLALHGGGFLTLTCVFWLTLRAYGHPRRRRVRWVLLVMPVYSGLDELTQPWFGRDAAWADWAADLVGASLALIVLELIHRALARRRRGLGA